ncbi:hypothetical protein ACWE42_01825 [Sutcliffiella cohnii]
MLDLTSLVLGSLLVVLVAFIISRFIQDRMKVIVITFVFIVGLFMLANILAYTSFTKYASKYINEETTINNVTITVYDLDDRGMRLDYTSITIEDEKVIDKLLQDFSQVKLKKDLNTTSWERRYNVMFSVTNPASDGKYVVTGSYSFNVDEKYLNDHKIINSTNHLSTIEEIIEYEDL